MCLCLVLVIVVRCWLLDCSLYTSLRNWLAAACLYFGWVLVLRVLLFVCLRLLDGSVDAVLCG